MVQVQLDDSDSYQSRVTLGVGRLLNDDEEKRGCGGACHRYAGITISHVFAHLWTRSCELLSLNQPTRAVVCGSVIENRNAMNKPSHIMVMLRHYRS